jgi:hypothetical protein
LKKLFKKILQKLKAFFKWLIAQLKDRTNIIIFCVTLVVLSSEVWVPYLLALITGNNWWWAVGSACWAFWLAPGTPFTVIALALTFAIRKIYDKIVKCKRKKDDEKDEK